MPSAAPTRGEIGLEDVGGLREVVLARPPRIVRGTLYLCAGLVASTAIWMSLARAQVIVVARGVVQSSDGGEGSARPLAFALPGTVEAVHVREGERVVAGAELLALRRDDVVAQIASQRQRIGALEDDLTRIRRVIELSDAAHGASRARALGELESARADLAAKRSTHAAEIELAALALERARAREQRVAQLLERGVAAAAEYDEARADLAEAKTRVAIASQGPSDGVVRGLEHRVTLLDAEQARDAQESALRAFDVERQLAAAAEQLAALEIESEHAVLRAPIPGVVTSVSLEPGELASAGEVAVTVAPLGPLRVEARVAGADIGLLRADLPVRVKVHAFDYQEHGVLRGEIEHVSPDALTDDDGPPGYALRVRLASQQLRTGARLRLGMAVDVEAPIETASLLGLAIRSVRRRMVLE